MAVPTTWSLRAPPDTSKVTPVTGDRPTALASRTEPFVTDAPLLGTRTVVLSGLLSTVTVIGVLVVRVSEVSVSSLTSE